MSEFISLAEKPMQVGPSEVSKSQKIYYPSITIPIEVFGENAPKISSGGIMKIKYEVNEIRKTDKGTECRIEIKSAKTEESGNKINYSGLINRKAI